jgi:hypothetical protein
MDDSDESKFVNIVGPILSPDELENVRQSPSDELVSRLESLARKTGTGALSDQPSEGGISGSRKTTYTSTGSKRLNLKDIAKLNWVHLLQNPIKHFTAPMWFGDIDYDLIFETKTYLCYLCRTDEDDYAFVVYLFKEDGKSLRYLSESHNTKKYRVFSTHPKGHKPKWIAEKLDWTIMAFEEWFGFTLYEEL